MNLRRTLSMANREIPEAEMKHLALLNLQSATVDAAFTLFCGVAVASHHTGRAFENAETVDMHVRSIRTHMSLELQRLVAAKALAFEAHGAINLARRMAKDFPQHAAAIQNLQEGLACEFPELTAVRNSFAHLDERAARRTVGATENDSERRLWGLNGNILSVRGATDQLVEVTLSEKLPQAINRLVDGIVEIFAKKTDHDTAIDNLLASPVGAWIRSEI